MGATPADLGPTIHLLPAAKGKIIVWFFFSLVFYYKKINLKHKSQVNRQNIYIHFLKAVINF